MRERAGGLQWRRVRDKQAKRKRKAKVTEEFGKKEKDRKEAEHKQTDLLRVVLLNDFIRSPSLLLRQTQSSTLLWRQTNSVEEKGDGKWERNKEGKRMRGITCEWKFQWCSYHCDTVELAELVRSDNFRGIKWRLESFVWIPRERSARNQRVSIR